MSTLISVLCLLAVLYAIFVVLPKKLKSAEFSSQISHHSRPGNYSRLPHDNDVHGKYTLGDSEFQTLMQNALNGSEASLSGKSFRIPANAQVFVEYENEYKGSELEIKIRWKESDLSNTTQDTRTNFDTGNTSNF